MSLDPSMDPERRMYEQLSFIDVLYPQHPGYEVVAGTVVERPLPNRVHPCEADSV